MVITSDEMFFPANDTVHKDITMMRFIKHWLTEHKSINFSGFCVEKICEVIQETDPEYWNKYKHNLEDHPVRKHDAVKAIIKNSNTH